MFQVGELGAVITTNKKPFDRAMRDIFREGDKTSSAIESMFLTAGAAIGASFLAASAMAVKVASDAEEIEQKFDTVFSSISDKANQTAKDLEDGFGLSSVSARRLLGDTGDLLTGFGFTQAAALDLSKQVNELAVDLASFTNYSGGAEGASQALTKALLGERESVKSLGISILDADVKARMLLQRQQGLTFATERQAKAYATLSIATEQSKNAIGDFARTQHSLANQSRVSTERIEGLLAGFGGLIIESTGLNEILSDVNDELADLTTSIEEAEVSTSDLANEFRGLYVILREIPGLLRETNDEFFGLIKGIQTVQTGGITFFTEKFSSEFREMIREIGQADRFFKEVGKGLQMMMDVDTSNLTDIDAALGGIVEKAKGVSTLSKSINNVKVPVKELEKQIDELQEKIKGSFSTTEITQYQAKIETLQNAISLRMGEFKPDTSLADPVYDLEEALGGVNIELTKLPKDFFEKYFPKGSIASMQQELKNLEDKLILTTDPGRAKQLQTEIDNLNASIKNMRHSTEEANIAGEYFSHTLADGLDQVLFQARSVEDAFKGIIRQLASRALTTGLIGLFGGGFGAGGFLGAMFGGTFHSGGVVPGHGEKMILAKGGETVLTPNQMRSIIPNGSGGGKTLNLNISLDGKFTQRGTDLEAAIRETVRQQTRLG